MSTRRTPSVLVMAKAPRAGTVKTRLHPLLGPDGCAVLQAELIRHTLEMTSSHGLRTYLAYAPGVGEESPGDVILPGVRLVVQRGENLGQRLTSAVVEAFADGAGPLLVIGTDAPTLTRDHLTVALSSLEHKEVVLGPALDGGYYLIGMRHPHAGLFGIDAALWSTDKVLAATCAVAAEEGLSVELLRPLRDLDTPEDAAALLADPVMPYRIAALLQPTEAV
ncbi:TIGR04282 family arsenosugar biosynthesis glycosyltransferase [Streptomyces sp. ISL-100]|uniref:TIGR04282 family arsenosugar biosynthesis glycosyltransferase n=1 Tax=Streptomyces sp. ISL-100 TaxID=2819173 RepID=UPI001BEAB15D|nr:TIGR04282 family arsenosugar biosynthesis glycosyltransferase [Streptomyces sp. ISL-100]MBT2396953.1 TIGR04282 family arsenosugar biosynthesis glycosyltransferase [Streptomyces sp. ISL-100]